MLYNTGLWTALCPYLTFEQEDLLSQKIHKSPIAKPSLNPYIIRMKTQQATTAIANLQADIAKVEASNLRADQKRNMVESLQSGIKSLEKRNNLVRIGNAYYTEVNGQIAGFVGMVK